MGDKKVTVWTKKGGCGKTNITAEIALRLQYPVITNEPESMLSHVIPKGKLKILGASETVPHFDCGMLFDFGGYIDERIIDAIYSSDYVIVPTLPEISDLQGSISTIQTIKKINKNIIVIANKTEQAGDFQAVKSRIAEIGDYPVFEIKKSRALPNIYIEKCSILDTMKKSPLLNYNYRKISRQFNDIIEYVFK